MMMKQPDRYVKTVPSPDFPWEGIVGKETTEPLCTSGFRVKCTVSRTQISHPALTSYLYKTYTCPSLPSIIERQSGETALSYKRLGFMKTSECEYWKSRGYNSSFWGIAIIAIQYHQKESMGRLGAQNSNGKSSMADRIQNEIY